MEPMKLSQAAQAMGGSLWGGENVAVGISLDSRTIKPGDLFFAIKGPKYDGHDFVIQALKQGAVGAVVRKNWLWTADFPASLILVDDTLSALHRLARDYRTRFSVRMVAITGTNGKTTTKEMISAIVSSQYPCLKNQGNLNNLYGLPLSLAQLSSEHRVAVMEMGMSALGEIAQLCRIAEPEIGVITNVAEGHTEFLGDVDGVARAKGELLAALPAQGTAVINADCEILMRQAGRTTARIVTFGIDRPADVRAQGLKFEPQFSSFSIDGQIFTLGLPGRHNIYNALAAVAVADVLGISREVSRENLSQMKPVPMRLNIQSLGEITLINDAYNSNPESAKAALSVLSQLRCRGRRIAVLADMLELGDIGPGKHAEIGRLAGQICDLLVAVGSLAKYIHEGAEMPEGKKIHCQHNREAIEYIMNILRPGDVVLVKGSRGMRLEEVVQAIQEGF